MNYELVKQLKDAGFPIRRMNGINMITGKDFYTPTLEELIEACGDKFGQLIKYVDGWVAENNWKSFTEEGIVRQAKGSTPIEAVAKLWLGLNKSVDKPIVDK